MRFHGDLGARLDAVAVASTKAWWERYPKGAVPFRGVKVLGPFVVAGDDPAARPAAIAARTSDVLWLRRAAAVADPTRWSRTSVGWLLREPSEAEPRRVRAFLDAHPEISAEARRAAAARFSQDPACTVR